MPNPNYEKGRRFEYKVRDNFRKRGYIVYRSAGSHSPADLVAMKAGEIILIQCQTYPNFAKAKVEQLLEHAKEMSCRAQLYWTQDRKMYCKELTY